MKILGLFKRKSPKDNLVQLLGDAELPVFPALVLQALALLRDPESSPSEIGRLVASDPGLSVRVLRMANSSAYRDRAKVKQRTGHTHAEARRAWPRSVKDFVTCSLDSTRHATKEGTRLRHQRQTRRDLRSRVSVLRTAGKHGRPRNDRRPQRLMRDLSIAHWYSRSREYAPRAPARRDATLHSRTLVHASV